MGLDIVAANWGANKAADIVMETYIKRTEMLLFMDTAYATKGEVDQYDGKISISLPIGLSGLVAGKKYRIRIYGDEILDCFEGIAKKHTIEDMEIVMLGNIALTDYAETGSDSGEHYFATILDGTLTMVYLDPGYVNLNHVQIELVEITETIDPKYIPGVCLPVVELKTELGDEPVFLSAEDVAVMESVSANGMPIIVKGSFAGMTFCSVFNALSMDGTYAYIGYVEPSCIMLGMADTGDWAAQII